MAKIEVGIEALDGFVIAGLREQMEMQIALLKGEAERYAMYGGEVHIANILDHAATYWELRSILEYYGG
jgi:hypothetical protein